MKIERKITVDAAGKDIWLRKGDVLDFGDSKWRVLDINEEEHKAFIMKFTSIKDMRFGNTNDYEKSNIRRYLHSDEFLETLPDELLDMVASDFNLLTAEEIEKYMPNLSDRLAFDMDGYTTWYWTATAYPSHDYERYVNSSGALYNGSANYSGGVVPACYIRHHQ